MKKYVMLRISLTVVQTVLHHELMETTVNQENCQRIHSAAFFHKQSLKLREKKLVKSFTKERMSLV